MKSKEQPGYYRDFPKNYADYHKLFETRCDSHRTCHRQRHHGTDQQYTDDPQRSADYQGNKYDKYNVNVFAQLHNTSVFFIKRNEEHFLVKKEYKQNNDSTDNYN